MPVTAVSAAILISATLAGAAAGAAIQAAATVSCSAPAPIGDSGFYRFMATPPPPTSGGARY